MKIGVVGLLAAATFAHAGAVKLAPGPFELPDHIGPMVLQGEPHRYEDPRLGASYQYFGGGLSLTIYVYDLGVTDIPDGGDTLYACEAFEGAKGDLAQAGYANLRLVSEQLARLDPGFEEPTAREAVYEYTRENQPTISYLWVTGAAKQFVKLRFSVNEEYRDELPEARRVVLDALGVALLPHVKIADAKPDKGVALTMNPKTDVSAAMLYLATLSTVAEKQPDLTPPCGGDLVPPFVTEVSALQATIELGGMMGRNKLLRQLGAINEAGFLDEFVWTYRHRDDWGATPPEGLDLPAFEKYRAKKLRGFAMPDLGSVSFSKPRPLPVEAAPAAAP